MASSLLSRVGFGMQCFWGAEALFGSLVGVHSTRVGYAGGSSPAPTYRNLADHIETVDIEFDASRISFEKLVEIFFKSHDPTVKYKRQYISAIFYHNQEQRKSIDDWIKQNAGQFTPIVTELIEFTVFHNAEDYHQKYFLRKYKQILNELNLNNAQIITSPISTRLNGFCAGFGSLQQLEEEKFNLSNKSVSVLQELIKEGPNLHECGI